MKKKLITIITLFICFPLFAEDFCEFHPEECPSSVQEIEGGLTTQLLIEQITTTIPQTFILGAKPRQSAGANLMYSSHLKAITLPLSYSFRENIDLNLSVPYLKKELSGRYDQTGEELSRSGLGDISLGTTHTQKKDKFYIISNFTLKIPTGDQSSFSNGQEQLPLGTGSFDLIFSSAATIKVEQISGLKLTGSVYLRINGSGNYTEETTFSSITDDFEFKNSAGNSLGISIGGIYKLPWNKWFAYSNFKYLHVGNSEETVTNNDPSPLSSLSYELDLQDSLSAIDLTLGGQFLVQNDITFRAGIAIPISTSYDTTLSSVNGRDIIIDLGVDYFW